MVEITKVFEMIFSKKKFVRAKITAKNKQEAIEKFMEGGEDEIEESTFSLPDSNWKLEKFKVLKKKVKP